MKNKFALLAGNLGLLGLLAAAVTPPSAFTCSARKRGRGFSEAGYKADNARYEKRVQFYETEYRKLQGHGRLNKKGGRQLCSA